MPEPVLCKICGKRRARRSCPAVHGEICALCCGEQREVSLLCPLSCDYLQEAHRREKPISVPDKQIGNPEIEVTEQFVRSHEEPLLFVIYSLLQAALRTPGAVDMDVMAALEALIQTHRTAESGLVYQTRAENASAAAIQAKVGDSLASYQKIRGEREAVPPLRNAEILGMLVFLHRIGQQNQNGKPRGRMFMDMLGHMTPDGGGVEERAPSIIL